MSLRARQPNSDTTITTTSEPQPTSRPQPQPPSSAISQTLATTANLAKLLPTGTLLAFQILTPIFTNNGSCDTTTRSLTSFLLFLLSLSAFLACFTDSFKTNDGQLFYGFATFQGMWILDYYDDPKNNLPDLRKFKLRLIDFVHAMLSVLVFGGVAFRDKNVVNCFYPNLGHEGQEVLDIVPIGVGLISSALFVVFPTRRHGIGYPVTHNNSGGSENGQ